MARKRRVERYEHESKRRNNPPVGLATSDDAPARATAYAYDEHFDPSLRWAGKAERESFAVDEVSLHVHEKIDPHVIIDAARSRNGDGGASKPLFETVGENPSLREAVEFYRHEHNWSNRLVAGDSLLVMNSLLQREGMTGAAQCVYMDPPYGIKYGSNFQPFVGRREVKDGADSDLTVEPEMIKAFRDTWELGIHSYLSYLRDRLLLARELLADSGSCFVQISDDNVHLVRCVMDEIFGAENFVVQIAFRTKNRPMNPKHLEQMCDFAVWYAKSKPDMKYRRIFSEIDIQGNSLWKYIGFPDGGYRKLSSAEIDNHSLLQSDFEKGGEIFRSVDIEPVGVNQSRIFPVELDGEIFTPRRSWSFDEMTMKSLARKRLLFKEGKTLCGKYFRSFYPVQALTTPWTDTNLGGDKRYVVQTSTKVIQRCLLMTTDPGDLVIDPTCGSGTAALVAEQWGRRWITCDTSRVALAIVRQRLMTAVFDYYRLDNPEKGVGGDFAYKTVSHLTLKSIANDEPQQKEILRDQPLTDNKKVRVSGPFTVEAASPSPIVKSVDELAQSAAAPSESETPPPPATAAGDEVAREGETVRHEEWRRELLQSGVRAKGKNRVRFSRVDSFPARWLHAEAETAEESPKRVFVSFGPEHSLLERRQVELALQEAQKQKPAPGMIVFAAFEFDPEAAKDIDETNWAGVRLLKAKMNPDLQIGDLKKAAASGEAFWLMGQPDVRLTRADGEASIRWQVEVRGFDYYNPRTGSLDSGDSKRIAAWLLDTDYDGRALYPRQVFFPMAGEKSGWQKLAKNLRAEIDADKIAAYAGTKSLPFQMGEFRRVAVKIIDDRGIESMRIINL